MKGREENESEERNREKTKRMGKWRIITFVLVGKSSNVTYERIAGQLVIMILFYLFIHHCEGLMND